MTPNTIRIGTRGSQLALWQAGWVKTAIEQHAPGVTVALDIIKTKGDKILDVPLAKVGGKGLFVKEIEEAILDGRIDLAVHSMKDMPAELPSGLAITAIPRRENPLDALDRARFLRLLECAAVWCRRWAPAACAGPPSCCASARMFRSCRCGATWTRGCGSSVEQNLDAIVLAAAGLIRLGLSHGRITEYAADPIRHAAGSRAGGAVHREPPCGCRHRCPARQRPEDPCGNPVGRHGGAGVSGAPGRRLPGAYCRARHPRRQIA
jgi:hydroxymethylbilane synthase